MFWRVKKATGWAIFLIVFSICSIAHASKEGILIWSNFSIESQGIGASGPVKISGVQTNDRISNFRVVAFGLNVSLNSAQLDQLREFPMNGMQLSYEKSIWGRGRRVLYVTFFKGFSSGAEKKMLIAIDDEGSVTINNR